MKKTYGDSRHYDDKPKLRGVIFSTIFAFITYMIAANMLAMVIYGLYRVGGLIATNPDFKIAPFFLCYSGILLFSMFMDAFGHFTPFIAFFQCRVEPSLREAFMFSILGRREFGIRFRS